ncbi:MAG: hypothetical protein ACSW8E_01230 [Clostridia bacterium]
MKKTSCALRLLCLALCLIMLLSLAACGGGKEQPEAPAEPAQEPEVTPEPTPEPTPAPTPTVDSLAIYYMGEPIADNDCTMKVGETLPLSIVATPGGIAGEVLWAVDPVCEDSFELKVSEGDPYRATLKGVSVLPDDAGGAKISATLYGATATIVVHVLPGEGGITSVYKPAEDQTLEIRRARGDYHVDSITISPGYETRLSAAPLKGGKASDVVWSMDEQAAKILVFTPSSAYPDQMILECFGPLPEGVNYVEIYAELDGYTATCKVRVNAASEG